MSERTPTRLHCRAQHAVSILWAVFRKLCFGRLQQCVPRMFMYFSSCLGVDETGLQWHTDVAIGHLQKWACFFMVCPRPNGEWLEKVCDKCYLEAGPCYFSWLCKLWVCNWMLFSECSFHQYVHFPPFCCYLIFFFFQQIDKTFYNSILRKKYIRSRLIRVRYVRL